MMGFKNAPCHPGKRALFMLGVDRFNVLGRSAYSTDHPHKDVQRCRVAYTAGVQAAENKACYQSALRSL